jgi:hypothetical protein
MFFAIHHLAVKCAVSRLRKERVKESLVNNQEEKISSPPLELNPTTKVGSY